MIQPQYRAVMPFRNGLAKVRVDEQKEQYRHYGGWRGRWGYIDKTGRMIVKPDHEGLGPLCDGRIRFCIRKSERNSHGRQLRRVLWGFLDKTGKVVIEPRFIQALDFSNGLAFVSLARGTGAFVDTEGNIIFRAHRGWRGWPYAPPP